MSSKSATKKPQAKKPAAPAAKVAKAKKATAEVVEPVSVPAPVAVVVPEVEATKAVKGAKKDKKVRQRREVSKQTLDETYEALRKRIEDEIQKLREATEKVKGVKFLRSVNKSLKLLQNDTKRVLAKKAPSKRAKNTASGFMKPVTVTDEMLSFTGWEASKRYSRVDVTKYICDYIKTHDLQNPADRRNINANPELCKLLRYDPKTATVPLTYFRVQQLIQIHFIKDTVPVVVDSVVDVEDEEA